MKPSGFIDGYIEVAPPDYRLIELFLQHVREYKQADDAVKVLLLTSMKAIVNPLCVAKELPDA